MLLHNGGCFPSQPYIQPTHSMDSSYYAYHQSLTHRLGHCDEYFGLTRTMSLPSIPYHRVNMHTEYEPQQAQSFSCPCPAVPSHQTFLHQILTGRGYINSALGVNNNFSVHKSAAAYPSSFSQSSCCFGNAVKPCGFSTIQ